MVVTSSATAANRYAATDVTAFLSFYVTAAVVVTSSSTAAIIYAATDDVTSWYYIFCYSWCYYSCY